MFLPSKCLLESPFLRGQTLNTNFFLKNLYNKNPQQISAERPDHYITLGARLRGRTATQRSEKGSKKGSKKVLGRVLGKGSQKCSEKGSCYWFYSTKGF